MMNILLVASLVEINRYFHAVGAILSCTDMAVIGCRIDSLEV